jgi:hypothetical protein
VRTATELAVVERVPELLRLPLADEADPSRGDQHSVPLMEGFKATQPKGTDGSKRRRRRTGSIQPSEANGLISSGGLVDETSLVNLHVGRRKPGGRKSDGSGRSVRELNKEELEKELAEATEDRQHVDVRRVCYNFVFILLVS